MLTLETREQLEALHHLQAGESLTLEYKASDAISNSDGNKSELARDVSAFANAAGGQIVYGMTEHNHVPAGLDIGIDRSLFPGLWFEQVLESRISPTIEGLRIHEISLGPGRIAVVITIPAAGPRAPHQASDGKYYRRRNFQRTHMEDYEVREAMRRSTTPDLYLEFSFDGRGSKTRQMVWPAHSDRSDHFELRIAIGNRANEPALYSLIRLYVDEDFMLLDIGEYEKMPLVFVDGKDRSVGFNRKLLTPHFMPIFNGPELYVSQPHLALALPRRFHDKATRFSLGYEIWAPGLTVRKKGHFQYDENGQFHMRI
jgi:hypothetical protein